MHSLKFIPDRWSVAPYMVLIGLSSTYLIERLMREPGFAIFISSSNRVLSSVFFFLAKFDNFSTKKLGIFLKFFYSSVNLTTFV
jgi:hypothetical protein